MDHARASGPSAPRCSQIDAEPGPPLKAKQTGRAARLGALEQVGDGEDRGLGLAAGIGEDRAGDRHELERGVVGHRLAAEPHLAFALDRRSSQELLDQLAAPLLGVLGRRRRGGGGGGCGRSGRGVGHRPILPKRARVLLRRFASSLNRTNRHEAPRRQRHHRPCRQRLPDRRHAAPGAAAWRSGSRARTTPSIPGCRPPNTSTASATSASA